MKTALVDSLRNGDFFATWQSTAISGVVVGIVALPLSMGSAIAVGLSPQHWLYTAIVGGVVSGLLSGVILIGLGTAQALLFNSVSGFRTTAAPDGFHDRDGPTTMAQPV